MATFALTQPRHASSSGAPCQIYTIGGPEHLWIVEAALQTYKKGQMVYLDTSGNVAICTQTSSRMTSPILGFATKDGQNGSAGVPRTKVHCIRTGDILIANIWHTTAASALTNRNQLGDVFGLTLVTPSTGAIGTAATDVWVVDISTSPVGGEDAMTAVAKVQVMGFPSKYQGIDATIGDRYGPVLVQVVPFTQQTEGSGLIRNLQIK